MLTAIQRDMITRRKPFTDSGLQGYTTRGGTYILAVPAVWTDSGKPRDLAAFTPEGDKAITPLSPTVNPDLLVDLHSLLLDEVNA